MADIGARITGLVIDDTGVAPVEFERTAAGWTNRDEISIRPGGLIHLDGGVFLTFPEVQAVGCSFELRPAAE